MINFEWGFRDVHCDQQAKLIGGFAGLSQADFVEPPNHARRKPNLYATTWPVLLVHDLQYRDRAQESRSEGATGTGS